jgi:hypothetical protein
VNAIPVDTSGRRVGAFVGTTATTISGFIDPNSPNVAIYSRDRPTTFNDNLYFSGATNLNNAGALMTNASLMGSSGAAIFTAAGNGAGVPHRGPGVFSGGALTAAGGLTVSGGLTANGLVIVGVPTTVAGNGTSATFNLAVSNFFIHGTSVSGAVTYTIQNSVVGCVFYIVASGTASGVTVSQAGCTFSQSISTLVVTVSQVITVVRTA